MWQAILWHWQGFSAVHVNCPVLVGISTPLVYSNFGAIVSATTKNIQSQVWNRLTLKSLAGNLSSVHLPLLIPSVIFLVQVDLSPLLSLVIVPVKIQNLFKKAKLNYIFLNMVKNEGYLPCWGIVYSSECRGHPKPKVGCLDHFVATDKLPQHLTVKHQGLLLIADFEYRSTFFPLQLRRLCKVL